MKTKIVIAFWMDRLPFVTKGLIDELASNGLYDVFCYYFVDNSDLDRKNTNTYEINPNIHYKKVTPFPNLKNWIEDELLVVRPDYSVITGAGFKNGVVSKTIKSNSTSKIVVVSEKPIYLGKFKRLKNFLAPVLSFLHSLKYKNDIDYFFAYGDEAYDFFVKTGWKRAKVHKLIYTPQIIKKYYKCPIELDHSYINYLYIGRFDYYVKGLDLLIGAMKNLKNKLKIRFYFIGDYGNNSAEVKRALANFSNAYLLGVKDIVETQNVIGYFDYLIVPSKKDGWNVNPFFSLHANVPCIVSSRSGSCDLINKSKFGYVFKPTKYSLQKAIEKSYFSMLCNSKWLKQKQVIVEELLPLISAKSVANYFTNIITSTLEEKAPWDGFIIREDK